MKLAKATTRTQYNERVECRRHEGEIAAICPQCYDAALVQQERQLERERARAHTLWLMQRRAAA